MYFTYSVQYIASACPGTSDLKKLVQKRDNVHVHVHVYVHACIHCMFISVYISVAAMKKVKHRLVEKMNESTADSLGLSRAVLVNGRYIFNSCSN